MYAFLRYSFLTVNLTEASYLQDYLGWFGWKSQSQDGGKKRQRQRQQQIKILCAARTRRIVCPMT